MITLSFGGSDERVAEELRGKSETIMDALERKMQAMHLKLQRHIQMDKLSGQVLKNRTGTLRRSIHATTIVDGTIITSTVAVDPVASIYGKVHEYGGIVSVREHARRTKSGGTATVRSHNTTYPERSFMRTGFMDMKQQIIEGLQNTVVRAVRQ